MAHANAEDGLHGRLDLFAVLCCALQNVGQPFDERCALGRVAGPIGDEEAVIVCAWKDEINFILNIILNT
jgi:hypothetical protein